ncbi:hypothetical protein HYPSUDRAFT_54927 [Hypholoma sublateritium FD-334 SS-4]|uniref:Uncharacterized protein n=1 Tax=Hypholoma sublateritium (strain FD-334 SS-4) TaxID=945553 RepID=A0A0D2NU61_HYPSF|nr:hypothetical protein HYPSUDRAFT_54927 [Hypholoma sublateritium FD-334 SS-4]
MTRAVATAVQRNQPPHTGPPCGQPCFRRTHCEEGADSHAVEDDADIHCESEQRHARPTRASRTSTARCRVQTRIDYPAHVLHPLPDNVSFELLSVLVHAARRVQSVKTRAKRVDGVRMLAEDDLRAAPFFISSGGAFASRGARDQPEIRIVEDDFCDGSEATCKRGVGADIANVDGLLGIGGKVDQTDCYYLFGAHALTAQGKLEENTLT